MEANFGQALVDFQIIEVKITIKIITQVEFIKSAKWYNSKSSLSSHTLSSLLIKSWLRTSLNEVILIRNRGRKSIISRSLAVPKPRSRRCCLMFVNSHHNVVLSLVFLQVSASPSPSAFPLLKVSIFGTETWGAEPPKIFV